MNKIVAALYVEKNGSYFDLPDVVTWDETKDARRYPGPYPVVAHPPCARWGKLFAGQPLWIKRTGIRKIKGDDQGCFKSALFDVRRFGGVLEHPWGSHAWDYFSIKKPPRKGGWIEADEHGGWTCCVEQGQYGHYAPKPTLLYVYGTSNLPALKWGITKIGPQHFPKKAIEKHGFEYCKKAGPLAFKGGGIDSSIRISTPIAFRDLLLKICRSTYENQI